MTELTLNGFMAEGYVLVDNKRGGVEWLDVAGNPLEDDGSEMMTEVLAKLSLAIGERRQELVFERLHAVHEIFRLMEDAPERKNALAWLTSRWAP